MDILIKNGKLISPSWTRKEDVLIEGDKIVQIAPSIRAPKTAKVIDASGKYVLPGLIDAHTHYGLVSRGTVTCDEFVNGSKVAVMGGVTTVIDFADNEKGRRLSQSAQDRIEAMGESMAVDFSLHQGVYRMDADVSEQLDELSDLGIKTLKIFTTYRDVGYLIEDEKKLTELFRLAKKKNMLITAHCEDNAIIENTLSSFSSPRLPSAHPLLRPAQAEALAIRALGKISLKTSCPLYVVHTSSYAGYREIISLRNRGAMVYMESTPTYLFKDETMLSREDGALFIMTPPLRSADDNKKLQGAVKAGMCDVIATDHCAFTRDQKLSSTDCTRAYPGVPGTAEMFSSCYTYLTRGSAKMSINNLVSLMSENPARIFGLYPRKGVLAPGSDADVAIFDPKVVYKPADEIHSASGYTLFDTDTFTGKFTSVILRGNVVLEDGKYTPAKGEFLAQKR